MNDEKTTAETEGGSSTSRERDADFSKLAQVDEAAQKRIAELEQQLSTEHDNYLRALAELENYRRRAMKERSELLKYQGERVFADLIEVVDNFELALKHAEAAESDQSKAVEFRKGVELIHKMFLDILARWEVRAESGVGKEFDPARYEAISKVAVDDAKPGTIVNELKKAYLYKDKLLRVGSVVVAAAREESNPAEEKAAETAEPESTQSE
ncbi:MAG: nucleotide exchange factor GrpE [Bdellovibrionota bacterium]|nr:MAG: nucleotide exchange factor GrpE [Bdellovibrionota bacterium]